MIREMQFFYRLEGKDDDEKILLISIDIFNSVMNNPSFCIKVKNPVDS